MSGHIDLGAGGETDIDAIVAYLDKQSETAGDRFLSNLKSTFDLLASFPGLGSLKEYRGKRFRGIRSWAVEGFENYLIFYRFDGARIEVFAVLHGARQIRKVLKERLP